MSKWLVPHQKLDSQQKNFLDRIATDESNYRIAGFAGTGKTILLLYAIKQIRDQRPDASIVVVVFTQSLVEMLNSALSEEGVVDVPVMTIANFLKLKKRCEYVFCDEIQDMPQKVVDIMAERYAHIYVAGDRSQSIYDRFRSGLVDMNLLCPLIHARPFELTIVHRLPMAIQRAACELVPDLKKYAVTNNCVNETPDAQIRIGKASTYDNEVSYVWREASAAPRVGNTSAILVSSKREAVHFAQTLLTLNGKKTWDIRHDEFNGYDFGDLNAHLKANGIGMQYIGNGYGDFNDNGSVYLLNYYSAKGLDFDDVFLPGFGISLFRYVDRESDNLNRRIAMVAMTRARRNLYITHTGMGNRYLACIPADCTFGINIDDALSGKAAEPAPDDDLFGI